MIITETVNEEEIKSIILNPDLFKLTYGQTILPEEYKIDWSVKYLKIEKDKELVGLITARDLTRITLDAHIFILPKFQGKGYTIEISQIGHQWAIKQGYHSVFVSVPANCTHVLKFLKRINYKPCGLISKGIIYNGYLVSLILFEYDLYR